MFEWHFYESKTKTFFDLVEIDKKGKIKLVENFNRLIDSKNYQLNNEIETKNSLDDFHKQQNNDWEVAWNKAKKENFAVILPSKKRPRYKAAK